MRSSSGLELLGAAGALLFGEGGVSVENILSGQPVFYAHCSLSMKSAYLQLVQLCWELSSPGKKD